MHLNMKLNKLIILTILIGIVLHLKTLDNIYVGIYDDKDMHWDSFYVIKPVSHTYNLTIELEDNQEGYFFYNLGFGRYSTGDTRYG